MESRHDSENAERILFNLRPRELVRETLENDFNADNRIIVTIFFCLTILFLLIF